MSSEKVPRRTMPASIDEYIAGFTPAVQRILEKVRETIAAALLPRRGSASATAASLDRITRSACRETLIDRKAGSFFRR